MKPFDLGLETVSIPMQNQDVDLMLNLAMRRMSTKQRQVQPISLQKKKFSTATLSATIAETTDSEEIFPTAALEEVHTSSPTLTESEMCVNTIL